MAIAPSALGHFVAKYWTSDEELLRRLRGADLIAGSASDDQVQATFEAARKEHAALDSEDRSFNSPEERVRVFLAPFLTDKGRLWATPLTSLDLFTL